MNAERPMFACTPTLGYAYPEGMEGAVAFLVTLLALMGIIIAAGLIIAAVGRWSKRPLQEQPLAGSDLAYFRLLYERGECTQEEYERIRDRLGKKLRKEMKVPDPEKKGADAAAALPESAGPSLPGAGSGATIERTDGPAVGGSDTSSKPTS